MAVIKPEPAPYRPDVQIASLGDRIGDPVEAADFPETILRFRNDRWAPAVGLQSLDDDEWLRHFGRFEPLPDNLPQPLALRYHGHQFRSYNPEIGDGRGFLFAQLRDGAGRLLDLATKGSGTTPYSRRGDGRLTLKGGVREIMATEMLEALGSCPRSDARRTAPPVPAAAMVPPAPWPASAPGRETSYACAEDARPHPD